VGSIGYREREDIFQQCSYFIRLQYSTAKTRRDQQHSSCAPPPEPPSDELYGPEVSQLPNRSSQLGCPPPWKWMEP
jgi:hypothetical protein